MRNLRFSFGAAALFLATALSAQQQTMGDLFRTVDPKEFVKAFAGICLQNPGRLDKVDAIAQAAEYRDTPEPFWTMYAPQNADTPYHSWFALEGSGAPFILGVSEASLNGKTYQSCVVSNPFLDPRSTLEHLGALVELGGTISDETIAGQRTRSWLANEILDGAFISSADIGGMGDAGITLSITAPKQY